MSGGRTQRSKKTSLPGGRTGCRGGWKGGEANVVRKLRTALAPEKKEAAAYSPALHCSTIGANGLNFSVRNGKRWNPDAITT